MANTCKKSKTSHEGDDDLISQLPDEVLTRILSFNNTNSAVRTSVLSKRWNLVWASVPNLEFHFSARMHDEDERAACLGNLVDRVLSLNDAMSLRNVTLHCYCCDVHRVAAWFKSLAPRKAERWDLYLPRRFHDQSLSASVNLLPDGFFNQESLMELDLTNVVLRVPSTVCFPCLKTIAFTAVQLCWGDGDDDEPMKNLLSGCPAITDLVMSSDVRFPYKRLYFRSPTLRNLKIDVFCDEIVIDTPNVRHLVLNIQAATRAPGRSALVKMGLLHNLTHVMLSGIESREEVDNWLQLLTHTPNGVTIVFDLVGINYPGMWTQSLDLPVSIIPCIKCVKITERMVICYLYRATGLKKLIFRGFPTSHLRSDEFLKTFLPISNAWKRNKAFVPSIAKKLCSTVT